MMSFSRLVLIAFFALSCSWSAYGGAAVVPEPPRSEDPIEGIYRHESHNSALMIMATKDGYILMGYDPASKWTGSGAKFIQKENSQNLLLDVIGQGIQEGGKPFIYTSQLEFEGPTATESWTLTTINPETGLKSEVSSRSVLTKRENRVNTGQSPEAGSTGQAIPKLAGPVAGEKFSNSLGMEFVTIPAGSFRMGDLSGNGESDEKPITPVTIRKPFAMMTTEVTQGQWQAVMDSNPSDFKNCGSNCPVENVSWDYIQTFIQKLNARTGERYRLPSEAEWEYAARAGTTTEYALGNEIERGRANCDGCGSPWDGKTTAPVKSFAPNAWGLYDMHGNVWECVEDIYHDSYSGHSSTESAFVFGDATSRVLRGGSWRNAPKELRSATRYRSGASERMNSFGFRLVQGR